jgi:hypothetical protein
MSLLTKITHLADRLTHSRTTRWAVNHFALKRYGTMTQLRIDSKARSIDMELELQGESSPIHVHIDQYDFERLPSGDGTLVVRGITVSRPWMQELAKNLVESKPQHIPEKLAGYLAMVL